MALCDRLEAAQQEREQRRTRLTAASWQALTPGQSPGQAESDPTAARFALEQLPALTTRPQQIAALRQTILDLAVRGRLVKQDAKDEPAEVLLKRIAKDRAARVDSGSLRASKSLPPIEPEENGDELPSGWKRVRLGEVVKLWNGFAFKSSDFGQAGVPVIRIGDLQGGEVDLTGAARVPDSVARTVGPEVWSIPKGALLIAMSGATTGKVAINTTDTPILLNQRVGRLEVGLLNASFVRFFFETIVTQNLSISFGTAIPNLSAQQINETVFPLPPLAEQRRIVAKVDELMRLCDLLEAALVRGEAVKGGVLEAVLHTEVVPHTQPPAPVPLHVATGAPKPQRAYVEAEVELAMAAEPVAGLVKRGPGRPRKAPVTDENNTAEAILGYLQAHAGWHGKAAVLEATGIEATEWNAAIKELLEAGKVERQGVKKGARYRATT